MTKFQYRKVLIMLLAVSVLFGGFYYIKYIKDNIPDNIYIEPYKENEISLDVAFLGSADVYYKESQVAAASLNLMDNLSISGEKEEIYTLEVKLFGIFKIKDVSICVKEPESIIACGIPVGIHLETQGVLVVDTGNISTMDGEIESPSKTILKPGDYITEVNGVRVNKKSEIVDIIKNSSNIIKLKIVRSGEEMEVKVKAVKDENGCNKIGAWIRDDCQGLGTLTYIGTDMEFGALGHAICEENTGTVVNIKEGYLYTAKIWSIIKGIKGKPGEIVGSINYGESTYLGKININSDTGIYGDADESIFSYVDKVYLKTAYKQDVKTGKAFIRTFVSGEIEDYEINIYDLSYSAANKNKGIVFEITDDRLLDLTNGIVQGMSGSPIIQNDAVVGAVTHVFVNEPHKGYGIFIEEMLDNE